MMIPVIHEFFLFKKCCRFGSVWPELVCESGIRTPKVFQKIVIRKLKKVMMNTMVQDDLLIFKAVLRSRHFFGRLRLLMAKVPEPTPAPTYLGRLRLQAKRGGSGSIH